MGLSLVKIINLWKTRLFKTEQKLFPTDWRLRKKKQQIRRKNKKDKKRKIRKKKKKRERKKERRKREERTSFFRALYFVSAIFVFIKSLIILLYCKYRCIRESSSEAGLPDQAVVVPFIVPAGVPEWVTTPRLLCMHYYFNSMYSPLQETIQLYIPRAHQLPGSTETAELGAV